MEITPAVYLSLGSNLGNRKQFLENAIELLAQKGFSIVSVSSVYQTPAIGIEGAPDFLNCCVKANTHLNPNELIRTIHEIELHLGRIRRENETTSRTIDIDLIFYGNTILHQPDLQVPHPRYHERKFVLLPLIDLDDGLIDPAQGIPVNYFLKNCPDKSTVEKYPLSLFTKE
ncbi:MAG: hypothetical protein RIT43_1748 [Bacteroidota bacterium]|jgi:2-amino-4-hydroxy-6-hydroxymethyldihydropteridine diphosphokinase